MQKSFYGSNIFFLGSKKFRSHHSENASGKTAHYYLKFQTRFFKFFINTSMVQVYTNPD
jgi:hypothetical protein